MNPHAPFLRRPGTNLALRYAQDTVLLGAGRCDAGPTAEIS